MFLVRTQPFCARCRTLPFFLDLTDIYISLYILCFSYSHSHSASYATHCPFFPHLTEISVSSLLFLLGSGLHRQRMARPISRWVPFEFADAHPVFPICRPPFPPHMSEIDSLFSFFHLEVAFFNESIDAKLNRHAKSRLWARTPTPLLTSGVLPKAGYSGVVVPEKVRTVYNASMIAARPLKSQQQEGLTFLSFPISRTPIPAISQKDGFLRWRCWWSLTRESPRASPRRCSSSNGVSSVHSRQTCSGRGSMPTRRS